MPLPGGPADKLGNRYECYWTMLQLLRLLDGSACSIRIEDPSFDGAEFVLSLADGTLELHQCKRSHTQGKWTLNALSNSLIALGRHLADPKVHITFVSGSDASDLRELSERSRNAISFGDFKARFLLQNAWSSLTGQWSDLGEEQVWEYLRRTCVRTQDEQSIRSELAARLNYCFGSQVSPQVQAWLLAYVTESIHKQITTQRFLEDLKSAGFMLRIVANPRDAFSSILRITDAALRQRRSNLIANQVRRRAITSELLEDFQVDGELGKNIILLGDAGVGKSIVILEMLEALKSASVPVLYLRFDQIKTHEDSRKLGTELGLDESPVQILQAAADHVGKVGVLIIDQLDAVSSTSGRSVDRFDLLDELLEEAHVAAQSSRIRVVLGCRKFDWENDHRFRRLLDGSKPIVRTVEPFTLDEVRDVLSSAGYHADRLSTKQMDILRTPQNLFLLLGVGTAHSTSTSFKSSRDLFHVYWESKKPSKNDGGVEWVSILRAVVGEMSRKQQLFLDQVYLDDHDSRLVGKMVSDGVLTRNGRKYGFGHESFFDYCYAKFFVVQESSLCEYLLQSEQHLFRRSQVRQVLDYLRDDEPSRYIKELMDLVYHEGIRIHIKDAALSFLAQVPTVSDPEWELGKPFILERVDTIQSDESSPSPLALLSWRYLQTSLSWFDRLKEEGVLSEWLASKHDVIVDFCFGYLTVHTKERSDQVVELIGPYSSSDEKAWVYRFTSLVRRTQSLKNHRFLELVLSLIARGHFDERIEDGGRNDSFWNLFWGLSETQPDLAAEVIGAWSRRQVEMLRQSVIADDEFHRGFWFRNHQLSHGILQRVANKAPLEFLSELLPSVIAMAEITLCKDRNHLPYRDRIWSYIRPGDQYSTSGELLQSLIIAMEAAASKEQLSSFLNDMTELLLPLKTWVGNYLLLCLYRIFPAQLADQCAVQLSHENWRLDCTYGFASSPCWVARETLSAITPQCSTEHYEILEKTILGYVHRYEKNGWGYKKHGEACFVLLSGIDGKLLSHQARRRLEELRRKFGKSPSPPQGIQLTCVGSPISNDRVARMSDRQWLSAIRKYNSQDGQRGDDLSKGGGMQLADLLREKTKEDPSRFARLAFRFNADTYDGYFAAVLNGIRGANITNELRLEVCEVAFRYARIEVGSSICDVVGEWPPPVPPRALEILEWYIRHHPDPSCDDTSTSDDACEGDSIVNKGFNVVRGRAALALAEILVKNPDSRERLEPLVELLCKDCSIAVRSSTARAILIVYTYRPSRGVELLVKLVEDCDDLLLSTAYVAECLYHSLWKSYHHVGPIIARMIRSSKPEVCAMGACLLALASFTHEGLEQSVEECILLSAAHRKGVAEVASANIGNPQHKDWCIQTLLRLANDEDAEVISEVARSFWKIKDKDLREYEDFILKFSRSRAFLCDSFPLLDVLLDSKYQLPGIVCNVCKALIGDPEQEVSDLRSRRFVDGVNVSKLIFRVYTQHQQDQWGTKCLDIIDLMVLHLYDSAAGALSEYER